MVPSEIFFFHRNVNYKGVRAKQMSPEGICANFASNPMWLYFHKHQNKQFQISFIFILTDNNLDKGLMIY